MSSQKTDKSSLDSSSFIVQFDSELMFVASSVGGWHCFCLFHGFILNSATNFQVKEASRLLNL